MQKIPPVRSRPFLVAELGAVWLGIDAPMPSDLQIGYLGNGKSYKINANLAADLRPSVSPVQRLWTKSEQLYFPTMGQIDHE